MVGIAIIIQNIGGELTSISLYTSIIMFDMLILSIFGEREYGRVLQGETKASLFWGQRLLLVTKHLWAQVHSLLSLVIIQIP